MITIGRIGSLLKSKYVGLLEAEVTRLRAENRALTNSLLGTAGFPPVDFPSNAAAPQPLPRVRKRSWHQIQWAREAASGSSNGPAASNSESNQN